MKAIAIVHQVLSNGGPKVPFSSLRGIKAPNNILFSRYSKDSDAVIEGFLYEGEKCIGIYLGAFVCIFSLYKDKDFLRGSGLWSVVMSVAFARSIRRDILND